MTDVSSPRSTAEEAQRRVDRIRGHVSSAWEEVIAAYKHRDHEALGYGTGQAGWDAYILGEFGESRLSLPRHQRVERVVEASQSGMSDRAIASAAGVGRSTIQRDRESQVAHSGPPVSPATAAEPTFDPTPSWDPVDTETGEIQTEPRPITGIDGKTYSRPEPKEEPANPRAHRQPTRGRSTDLNALQITAAGLTGYVSAIQHIASDDLDSSVTASEAAALHSDLTHSIKTLSRVAARLNERKKQ